MMTIINHLSFSVYEMEPNKWVVAYTTTAGSLINYFDHVYFSNEEDANRVLEKMEILFNSGKAARSTEIRALIGAH